MKRSGSADLPLHYGTVPRWLAERMGKLGLAITEAIIVEYGTSAFVQKLSDPFWFQSLGAVMGMDWHSSGITTSVMGALKRAINPLAGELGLYICGGKGKFSKETPSELLRIADRTGLDGDQLVYASKLSAKVDNTAVQDGFQLYTHNFIVSDKGEWSVVQQGMHTQIKTARRYHWHSKDLKSFVDEPHAAVCGINMGKILNLTDHFAGSSRKGILDIVKEDPVSIVREVTHLTMPSHHDVRAEDIDLKRLGAALWVAHETRTEYFEDLLLLKGVGPRTLQSLALVSEVIHGTPSRFADPARFSFAHGGKDGHPFPVPTKVYDETIGQLKNAVERSKIGQTDKAMAIKKLHEFTLRAEEDFQVAADSHECFSDLLQREKNESWRYGGKTVFGDEKPPKNLGVQLSLF